MPDLDKAYAPRKYAVCVMLVCGHTVRTRVAPIRSQRFMCTANAGCGYRLRWVSWLDESSNATGLNHPSAKNPPRTAAASHLEALKES